MCGSTFKAAGVVYGVHYRETRVLVPLRGHCTTTLKRFARDSSRSIIVDRSGVRALPAY